MALASIVAPGQLKAMSELAYKVPTGDFAEIGVYNGGSAEVLYAIAEAQGRVLHLFDTFAGMPICDQSLDKHKIGEFIPDPGAEERIRSAMPKARLYVGLYPDTHPQDLPPLAFVHVDCDQYQSYRAVISRMWPLMVSGGVMIFDDYPYLEGAKKAVEEMWSPGQLRTCFQRNYVVKP